MEDQRRVSATSEAVNVRLWTGMTIMWSVLAVQQEKSRRSHGFPGVKYLKLTEPETRCLYKIIFNMSQSN